MQNDPLIIFTDLDGTLLDLHSYSYEGTESALSKIQKRNIPLIFCSSKTRTEQEFYQRELGIDHPFIVENGGAIFIRKDYFRFEYEHQKSNATYHVIEIGMSYKMIREKLTKIKNENGFKFNGYGDMSVDEVSALTGLNWEAAQRAMTREYSETINYVDSAEELHKLKLALQRQELQCSHGGRLQTVTATSNDKGKAVRILKNM
ncbi:MAG: HAD-IIB family hydrolase, partial [bacterium]